MIDRLADATIIKPDRPNLPGDGPAMFGGPQIGQATAHQHATDPSPRRRPHRAHRPEETPRCVLGEMRGNVDDAVCLQRRVQARRFPLQRRTGLATPLRKKLRGDEGIHANGVIQCGASHFMARPINRPAMPPLSKGRSRFPVGFTQGLKCSKPCRLRTADDSTRPWSTPGNNELPEMPIAWISSKASVQSKRTQAGSADAAPSRRIAAATTNRPTPARPVAGRTTDCLNPMACSSTSATSTCLVAVACQGRPLNFPAGIDGQTPEQADLRSPKRTDQAGRSQWHGGGHVRFWSTERPRHLSPVPTIHSVESIFRMECP